MAGYHAGAAAIGAGSKFLAGGLKSVGSLFNETISQRVNSACDTLDIFGDRCIALARKDLVKHGALAVGLLATAAAVDYCYYLSFPITNKPFPRANEPFPGANEMEVEAYKQHATLYQTEATVLKHCTGTSHLPCTLSNEIGKTFSGLDGLKPFTGVGVIDVGDCLNYRGKFKNGLRDDYGVANSNYPFAAQDRIVGYRANWKEGRVVNPVQYFDLDGKLQELIILHKTDRHKANNPFFDSYIFELVKD